MVFPGFLLHDVFLDRDGGIVRSGSCDLQAFEGTFRRCAIIRSIVTIPRARGTERAWHKAFMKEEPCGEDLQCKTVSGGTERVKVIEGCS